MEWKKKKGYWVSEQMRNLKKKLIDLSILSQAIKNIL